MFTKNNDRVDPVREKSLRATEVTPKAQRSLTGLTKSRNFSKIFFSLCQNLIGVGVNPVTCLKISPSMHSNSKQSRITHGTDKNNLQRFTKSSILQTQNKQKRWVFRMGYFLLRNDSEKQKYDTE